jgi:hypothetical protein
MNKAEKEFLAEVFGTTLNMPADKVESLFTQTDPKSDVFDLTPEAKKTVLDTNVERVKTFKLKETDEFQKGYKKAKAEERTVFEKEIKDAFADVKSDKIGLELINEIVASKSKAPEFDADKVKTHPEYLNLEKTLNKKLKETEDGWKKKFEDRESELTKAQVFSNVTEKAKEHLKTLNPILPTDPKKAANQLQLLMNDLKKFSYTDNKGDLIILGEDGKRLEDEHGKPVTFESLIKTRASEYWDFAEGEDRSGAGASNDAAAKAAAAAGASKKWGGPMPKNEADYKRMMSELHEKGAAGADDRILLMEAYTSDSK